MALLTARGISSEINVTPMIDILLVLLITFMAVTPVSPAGLEALLPHPPRGDAPAPEGAIVLQVSRTVTGHLAYQINQTAVARDEIRGRLTAIFSTRATKVMFIEREKELNFSPIAQSLDIARAAGADRVGLVTPRTAENR